MLSRPDRLALIPSPVVACGARYRKRYQTRPRPDVATMAVLWEFASGSLTPFTMIFPYKISTLQEFPWWPAARISSRQEFLAHGGLLPFSFLIGDPPHVSLRRTTRRQPSQRPAKHRPRHVRGQSRLVAQCLPPRFPLPNRAPPGR